MAAPSSVKWCSSLSGLCSYLVLSICCACQGSSQQPSTLPGYSSLLSFYFILFCLNHAFAYLSQISSCLLNKLELSSGEQPKALNQLERVLLFKNLKVSLSLLPSYLIPFFSCKHHVRDSYVVCSKSLHSFDTAWLLGRMHAVVALQCCGCSWGRLGRERPLFSAALDVLVSAI